MSNKDLEQGREFALKFIYQNSQANLDNLDNDLSEFLESYQAEDNEHPDNILSEHSLFFGKKLILGVLKNKEHLEKTIQNNIGKWDLNNLERIDRCLLLVGCYELTFEKTAKEVIINEGVNLAKKYGTEQSYRFINGVLDGINKSG